VKNHVNDVTKKETKNIFPFCKFQYVKTLVATIQYVEIEKVRIFKIFCFLSSTDTMTSWASTGGWASETAASLPPPPSTSNLSTSQSSSSSSLTHSLNPANTTTTTTSSLIDLEDTNVSNYHLLKKIGRGAFATCYLGKRNDGIYCAIKKFHTPLDELDVTLEASVHSEVESLKLLSLGTEYVTKYYGFFLDRCNSSHGGGARGATAPSFSLVVEYCNGGTLSELIDDHHNQNIYITEDRIMEIVVQCLEALRYVSLFF